MSWEQWLMPVIPALWEDHLSPGVQDQPEQHSETPSLLRIQKNWPVVVVHAYSPSYLGGSGGRTASAWEVEPGKSYHCTPAWVTE